MTRPIPILTLKSPRPMDESNLGGNGVSFSALSARQGSAAHFLPLFWGALASKR